MKTSEIKSALLNGENFENQIANWVTVCKPSANRFILILNDKDIVFTNIDSLAKKVSKLINKGY